MGNPFAADPNPNNQNSELIDLSEQQKGGFQPLSLKELMQSNQSNQAQIKQI